MIQENDPYLLEGDEQEDSDDSNSSSEGSFDPVGPSERDGGDFESRNACRSDEDGFNPPPSIDDPFRFDDETKQRSQTTDLAVEEYTTAEGEKCSPFGISFKYGASAILGNFSFSADVGIAFSLDCFSVGGSLSTGSGLGFGFGMGPGVSFGEVVSAETGAAVQTGTTVSGTASIIGVSTSSADGKNATSVSVGFGGRGMAGGGVAFGHTVTGSVTARIPRNTSYRLHEKW